MELIDAPVLLARAQATFDLYRTAKSIMRQNLRSRFPGETESEIEDRLLRWLRKESNAPSTKRRLQE